MNKTIAAIAVSAAFLSTAVFGASFNLTNGTSSTINSLYVSSASTESWEEELLGGQTIGSGETVQVTAPDYSKFDLMVTSTDGGEEIYYDFPGGVSSITLNGGGQANYQ